jgi:hypothetical protein
VHNAAGRASLVEVHVYHHAGAIGENHMAKGQKRTNREAKKPKSTKKKPAAPSPTVTTLPSKKA